MTQHCKTCRKDKDPSEFIEDGEDFKTCNECRVNKRRKRPKITLEDCKQFAIGKGGMCLSDEYKDNKTKMKWKCSENHEWYVRFSHIKNSGSWCPTCGSKRAGLSRRLTIQECKELAIAKGGECLSTEYTNSDTQMKWCCEKGHQWEARFDNVKYGGRWCPYCAGRYNNIEDCKQFAISKGGECLSTEYEKGNVHMSWRCEKGHEWEATFANIKRGHWCPKCINKSENACREIFEEHFQAKFPNVRPDFLEGSELDGYNKELNTAFEYNGKQHDEYIPHYHRNGIEDFEKQKERDRKKYQICAERKIKLVIIPYQYDYQHPKQLKQFILHQLS